MIKIFFSHPFCVCVSLAWFEVKVSTCSCINGATGRAAVFTHYRIKVSLRNQRPMTTTKTLKF